MAEDTITVTGYAERAAPPDVAAWRLTIAVTDREPRVAYDRCAREAAAVVERLKAAAEVETEQVSVEPADEYESGARRRVGHQAECVVVARAPIERAGEIADLAMESGAHQIRGPLLAVRDRTPVELESLDDAVADARRRAERVAAAAGRSLGHVLSIDTRSTSGFELRSSAISTRVMPVDPGDLTIDASVTVVFALAD